MVGLSSSGQGTVICDTHGSKEEHAAVFERGYDTAAYASRVDVGSHRGRCGMPRCVMRAMNAVMRCLRDREEVHAWW